MTPSLDKGDRVCPCQETVDSYNETEEKGTGI